MKCNVRGGFNIGGGLVVGGGGRLQLDVFRLVVCFVFLFSEAVACTVERAKVAKHMRPRIGCKSIPSGWQMMQSAVFSPQ